MTKAKTIVGLVTHLRAFLDLVEAGHNPHYADRELAALRLAQLRHLVCQRIADNRPSSAGIPADSSRPSHDLL